MNIGITGIGHAAPNKTLTNADLEKVVETSDEWIVSRTGIHERRIAEPGQVTSDWAYAAAKQAIAQAGIKAEDIDLIVIGTTTPDMPLPSCACIVQEKLGATNAAAFDVAAACSGFVYALTTAHKFLLSKSHKTALVIGVDQISSFIDWSDRATCILFGDAGGACILQEVDGRGIMQTAIGSDGRYKDLITIPAGGTKASASQATVDSGGHYLKMNGKEVFKHAVRGMVHSITELLEQSNLTAKDIKCLVPHQANLRIIDAVSSRLDMEKEKIYLNLDRYGNTSAASVIVALSEAHQKQMFKKGDLILLSTFGAGLVWGSALLEWSY
ncbi:MAG: 3-oxoacyl-[acyl-carrier-protein] synthase-3 [Candidatus Omnitrophota bacterium]|jgi:3-oxoacyl-[acyl-carrier-protein] synthase-3